MITASKSVMTKSTPGVSGSGSSLGLLVVPSDAAVGHCNIPSLLCMRTLHLLNALFVLPEVPPLLLKLPSTASASTSWLPEPAAALPALASCLSASQGSCASISMGCSPILCRSKSSCTHIVQCIKQCFISRLQTTTAKYAVRHITRCGKIKKLQSGNLLNLKVLCSK